MVKRIASFILSLSIMSALFIIEPEAVGFTLSAKSAIIINGDTLEVVYEKNSREKRGMASTTKIMTSILAIESGDLERTVTAKEMDVMVEGTSLGLKEGDSITLSALVHGMLLASGNDSANVTATALSGSKEEFALLMNNKAKEIGMLDSSFKNPSGLTEDGHYSTAYDMALLGAYAIKNPVFREICSLKSSRISFGNPESYRTLTNHNKLLSSFEGTFGIKTGYTKASGRCLVTAVCRDGATFVAVTLGAPDDWNDHKKMYEYAFSAVKKETVSVDLSEIEIPVVGSDTKYLKLKTLGDLSFYYNNVNEYSVEIYKEQFVYSGIFENDVVGQVEVKGKNGVLYKRCPLV